MIQSKEVYQNELKAAKNIYLHPPKPGSCASKSPGHHDAQENKASGEEGDCCAQHRRLNGGAQACIDWTLDGDEKAGSNHDKNGK